MGSAELNALNRHNESIRYCANCGRPEHTNPLWEEMLDGENKPIMIEVCKYFREQKEAKNDN
jgi:predicted Fe-S protein YdhL (DUF1289 family)